MRPPQTPASPWPANPRRGMLTPPPLSPSFYRSAFHAAAAAHDDDGADGADGADVTEHPYVELLEWWLASVEGDEQKVAVAGSFERNQAVEEFSPAPIAKRHEACVLETEDGIIVHIYGSLNITQTLRCGYSIKVCEKFLIGFPLWWESCNILYPKAKSSYNTSNSGVDSTQFYLEKFQQGKHVHSLGSSLINDLNNAKNSLHNNADAFQKSSYLSNGTPRFEEYTCDCDIATHEKTAASNDDRERFEVVCNEVDMSLIAGSTLRERGHGDIDTDVSLLFTVLCANDVVNEEADTAPPTSTCNQQTPAASLKSQGYRDKTECISLDGTPRFEEYTCVGDIPTNEKEAASNNDSERYAAVSKEVDNVEVGLIAGSTLRESCHGDIATNVSLALAVECTNDAGNEGAGSTPSTNTCRKRTSVAPLKSQGCWKKPQRVALNEKVVPDQDVRPPEKPVGLRKEQISAHERLQCATRSPVMRSPVPYDRQSPLTRGGAMSLSMSTPEALKLRKTRSGRVVVPTLDIGLQRIVYDHDGSISGVIGLDSPAQRKGSKSKTDKRKKRKAR